MQNLAAPSPQQLTHISNDLAKKREIASKWAKLLLGCYRTGDANDPEVYTAAVIAVLADYSEEVMSSVCDPRRGLPAEKHWLPTVAEIRLACEATAGPIRREEERRQRVQAQLAARDEAEQQEVKTHESGEHDRIVAGFKQLKETLSELDSDSEREHQIKRNRLFSRVHQVTVQRMGGNGGDWTTPALQKVIAEHIQKDSAA